MTMLSIAIGYGGRAAPRKAATHVIVRAAARVMVLWALGLAAGIAVIMAPDTARAAPPIRLLVLGDSLSAGYGLAQAEGFEARLADALAAAGHPVTIIDGAVSGDTAAGGRARLDWALGDGADAAIVELGANDGLRGSDPAQLRDNLAAILDGLAARRIPVLFSGMYAPPNLGPDYARQFRAVFDSLGARPGVLFDPFFLEGVAREVTLNQPDGLHPNPAGVRRIVARLLPQALALVERAEQARAKGL